MLFTSLLLTAAVWIAPAEAAGSKDDLLVSPGARHSVTLISPTRLHLDSQSTASNGYVAAVMNDDGRFAIGTTGGDPARPSSAGKKLMYGYPSPGTSDTFVRIDGTNYLIHTASITGGGASLSGSTASITILQGDIKILEQLSLVQSPWTGALDTIQIQFTITNTSTTATHNVSLRTQLDTQLGNNDGAPFRVPGTGEVTTDKEFRADRLGGAPDIPPTSLVFDSLTNPTVIGLMTFTNIGFTKPDRVVLGYWPAAVGVYDYAIVPGRSFLDNNGDGVISGSSPDSDSSVVVYWGYPDARAFVMGPGATRTVSFYYGLGDYTLCTGSPLAIGIFSPSRLVGRLNGTSYVYSQLGSSQSTFTVSGFIANVGNSTLLNPSATIRFGPGISLVSGAATQTADIPTGGGTLAAGKIAEIDWTVTDYGRYQGLNSISVSAQATNASLSCLRNINLTAIANAVYGQATTAAGVPVAAGAITVYNSANAVAGTAVTQADGTFAVGGLPAGQYMVRLSGGGGADAFYQATVSNSVGDAQTINPGSFATGAALDTFAYPNPARQGTVRISFYADGAGSGKVQIYDPSGHLLQTIQADSIAAGWREVQWPIDDAANGVYLYKVTLGSRTKDGKIAVVKWRGR